MASGFAELFSNADNYTIAFDPSVKLTAAQKTTVLASQLLADYMYFDGNTDRSPLKAAPISTPLSSRLGRATTLSSEMVLGR